MLENRSDDEVARLVPTARFLDGGGMNAGGCSVRGADGGTLRVWGCGYSKGHGGENGAWQPQGEARRKMLAQIPPGVDILITHGPPSSLPREPFGMKKSASDKPMRGCALLLDEVSKKQPKVHVFGHSHEAHGAHRPDGDGSGTLFVAATSVRETTLTAENPPLVLDVPAAKGP